MAKVQIYFLKLTPFGILFLVAELICGTMARTEMLFNQPKIMESQL